MSNIWVIKDADGNVTNPGLLATEEFVKENFDYYEEQAVDVETPEQTAIFWRDKTLISSDWIVPITDHPQHAAYIAYRAALRDWPSTADFPDTKPTL